MSNVTVPVADRGKLALALPPIGLFVFWLATLVGAYFELFVDYPQHQSASYNSSNAFHPISYALLIGYAAVGFASVTARRMSLRAAPSRLNSAVKTFSLVFVIGSLITGAILGFAWFVGNFMIGAGTGVDEGMRVVNVYLPILIDAALLVFFILRAFVFTHTDDDDDADETAAETGTGADAAAVVTPSEEHHNG
jgi:hypothetical protein